MKNMLRNSAAALIVILAAVTDVFAAAVAPAGQGGSLLLTLFIGFFALIVVFQLVPACLLFAGMLRGLFSAKHKSHEKGSNV